MINQCQPALGERVVQDGRCVVGVMKGVDTVLQNQEFSFITPLASDDGCDILFLHGVHISFFQNMPISGMDTIPLKDCVAASTYNNAQKHEIGLSKKFCLLLLVIIEYRTNCGIVDNHSDAP